MMVKKTGVGGKASASSKRKPVAKMGSYTKRKSGGAVNARTGSRRRPLG